MKPWLGKSFRQCGWGSREAYPWVRLTQYHNNKPDHAKVQKKVVFVCWDPFHNIVRGPDHIIYWRNQQNFLFPIGTIAGYCQVVCCLWGEVLKWESCFRECLEPASSTYYHVAYVCWVNSPQQRLQIIANVCLPGHMYLLEFCSQPSAYTACPSYFHVKKKKSVTKAILSVAIRWCKHTIDCFTVGWVCRQGY